jgi:hypothetical protein
LDILALWHNVVLPLSIGIWLGGLLAMAVWFTRRSGGRISANILAVLIGLISVPVALSLIVSMGAAYGTDVRSCFECLVFAVIDAVVFWLVFLVGIETGFAFLFALLASWFSLLEISYLLTFAVLPSLPIWIMASLGKGMLSASLPQSSTRGFPK